MESCVRLPRCFWFLVFRILANWHLALWHSGTGTQHGTLTHSMDGQPPNGPWCTRNCLLYVAVRRHLAAKLGGCLKRTVPPSLCHNFASLLLSVGVGQVGKCTQVMAIMAGKPAASHRINKNTQLSQYRSRREKLYLMLRLV